MSRNISRKVAHARILTVKSPKILFFVKSEEHGHGEREWLLADDGVDGAADGAEQRRLVEFHEKYCFWTGTSVFC